MAHLPALDPIIHQPTRLRIMALMYRNRMAAFTWLRDQLGLTDGNLASHAGRLETAGYVRTRRALTPRGFQVQWRITPQGDAAFRAYLDGLHRWLEVEAGRDESIARRHRRPQGGADAPDGPP